MKKEDIINFLEKSLIKNDELKKTCFGCNRLLPLRNDKTPCKTCMDKPKYIEVVPVSVLLEDLEEIKEHCDSVVNENYVSAHDDVFRMGYRAGVNMCLTFFSPVLEDEE